MTNQYKTVTFNPGLTSVTYQIFYANGTSVAPASSVGVYEIQKTDNAVQYNAAIDRDGDQASDQDGDFDWGSNSVPQTLTASFSIYAAILPIPDNHVGYVTWSSGESTPIKQSFAINNAAVVVGQPYQQFVIGNLGPTKTGLTKVGYAIHNGLSKSNNTRITAGVVELGNGQYGALVSLPANFAGAVLFDSGETSPVYSNTEVNQYSGQPYLPGQLHLAGTPYVQHYSTNIYGDLDDLWARLTVEMEYYHSLLSNVDMTQISKNYMVNMYVSKIQRLKEDALRMLRILQDLNPKIALGLKQSGLLKKEYPSDGNSGY